MVWLAQRKTSYSVLKLSLLSKLSVVSVQKKPQHQRKADARVFLPLHQRSLLCEGDLESNATHNTNHSLLFMRNLDRNIELTPKDVFGECAHLLERFLDCHLPFPGYGLVVARH